MRNLFLALLLLLGVYFVITRFTEAQQVALTLQRGNWLWLLAAAFVQLVWLLNVAASYRAIYRALGIEERIERLIPLCSAAFFVNLVAPVAGMSGLAIFIAEARRRGQPVGRVSTASALMVLYDYVAFLLVLTIGLVVLFQRNQLSAAEVIASLILVIIAVGLAFLLYLGMRSPERLSRVLAGMASLVNRIARPIIQHDYLDVDRAHAFAHDAAEGLHAARRTPGNLLLPAALALSSKAFLISILFFVFLAFRQPFSVSTLIAGFSIGYLFLIVSPTPSGIGFVEGALTLTLTSLRVPLAPAALISLAYRGITLWFPFAYGAIAIRWVSRSAPLTRVQEQSASAGPARSGNPSPAPTTPAASHTRSNH
ncbi:MAG TPA: lysylphosphatidylglycerol synthase transmembrane domain-containing protein [Anaerolineales bacterium]|nr:lysylphosphatidylglycerol synthase transmembrane domain-containing protein [Anaerolineales bacterium]